MGMWGVGRKVMKVGVGGTLLTSGRNLDWMKGRSLTSASASAQYSLRTGEEEEGGEDRRGDGLQRQVQGAER